MGLTGRKSTGLCEGPRKGAEAESPGACTKHRVRLGRQSSGVEQVGHRGPGSFLEGSEFVLKVLLRP